MRATSGFTLIELLLVLAVIGIISALAVPSLIHQQERAKRNAVHTQTVAVISDLASVLGELSEPPSERKTGYPTTIYNGQATDSFTKAREAIGLVLAKPSFANGKNPYTGAAGGYRANNAPPPGTGLLGVVYLDASTANVDSNPVITVAGVFRNAKGNLDSIQKTVAVN